VDAIASCIDHLDASNVWEHRIDILWEDRPLEALSGHLHEGFPGTYPTRGIGP